MSDDETLLRYKAALQSIADSACCSGCQEAALVAKRALSEACGFRMMLDEMPCVKLRGHLGPHAQPKFRPS